MSTFFSLYACCIPVKGAKRSIVCDLQRDNYIVIPEVLYDILTDSPKPISKIKDQFNNEYNSIIDDYFSYLHSKDLGFFSDSLSNFPKLELDNWYMANWITNAIIDYDEHSDHNLESVSKELSELLCEALEVRCFSKISQAKLEEIINHFTDSTLRSIELTLHDDSYLDDDFISDLLIAYPRITKLLIHSAEANNFEALPTCYLIKTKDRINSEACCGAVSPTFFSVKTESFIESRQYNSCLNKKVGIDKNGFIKNCPSMKESFGNVSDTSIKDAIMKIDFKRFWNVTKDQIEICKDCEFRYICQDCRAYTKINDDMFSKPLKCNYDPYEAKWL